MDHSGMLAWTRMEMGRGRWKQGRVRREKQVGLGKEFSLRERDGGIHNDSYNVWGFVCISGWTRMSFTKIRRMVFWILSRGQRRDHKCSFEFFEVWYKSAAQKRSTLKIQICGSSDYFDNHSCRHRWVSLKTGCSVRNEESLGGSKDSNIQWLAQNKMEMQRRQGRNSQRNGRKLQCMKLEKPRKEKK